MEFSHVEFIRSVLPQGRTLFYTYRDHYAVYLLRKWMGDRAMPVHDIKRSPMAPFLRKPCLQPLLASAGGGVLYPAELETIWPEDTRVYRLSLGMWPDSDSDCDIRWDQVSRRGRNLVLQLNVNSDHKSRLERNLPEWKKTAHFPYHPIALGEELTLAWARMDLDLDRGEALIEEIQSDWVRFVKWHSYPQKDGGHEPWTVYRDSAFRKDCKDWAESMLCATLWFLFEELGLRTVFYHRHETGARMKRIQDDPPPRSLYTTLPERFGFQLTHNGPRFLRDTMNQRELRTFCDPTTRWYVLQI